MQLGGNRTGTRVVVCEQLELARADGSVRLRGPVRRARRGARPERHRQEPLPAPARGRAGRPRRRRGGSARASCPATSPRPTTSRELRGVAVLDVGDEGRARPGPGDGHPAPLRAARLRDPAVRDALGRPAGAPADPAARAVGREPAAARRAHRQPRPRVGRGARGGARLVLRHRGRGHPRPLVPPALRPVPRASAATARSASTSSPSSPEPPCRPPVLDGIDGQPWCDTRGHTPQTGGNDDGSGARAGRSVRLLVVVLLTALVAASCTPLMIDETVISSDAMNGRDNGTPGSAFAQSYLIARLKSSAVGLDASQTGDDAFKQPFDRGHQHPGQDPRQRPGRPVRDHRRALRPPRQHAAAPRTRPTRSATARPTTAPASPRCSRSRAMIKAARHPAPHRRPRALGPRGGRPARLEVLRRSTRSSRSPRRSRTSTSTSRARTCCRACGTPASRSAPRPAAPRLTALVKAAIGDGPAADAAGQLDLRPGPQRLRQLHRTCGVPNVFFSDSTGPCYHTAQDELKVVDFAKLDQQVGHRVPACSEDLIDGDARPTFSATQPGARRSTTRSRWPRRHERRAPRPRPVHRRRSSSSSQASATTSTRSSAAGAAAFDNNDVSTVIAGAAQQCSILSTGACDGFNH